MNQKPRHWQRALAAALLVWGLLLILGLRPKPVAIPRTQAGQQPTPESANQQSPASPATNEPHGPPPFLIVIDPGHGGEDQGAALGGKINEKDVTLALAHRLRAELQERGVVTHLLREADTTLSLEQRAAMANEHHPALYLALHAGIPGKGVRVYGPAFVSSKAPSEGKFLPWESAQANYLSRSQRLAREVATELDKKGTPAISLNTPLCPLNNINAPAIAIEMAADSSRIQDIMSQKTQTSLASAIAAILAQQRAELEKQ